MSEVYLSGGEPFEHPEIFEIIRSARSVAPTVAAYSAGIRACAVGLAPIEQETWSKARAAGLERVDLSFYADSEAAHDHVTASPGSFAATREAALQALKGGLKLGVHFVPLINGGSELLNVARLTEQLGASRLHVLALTNQGRAANLDNSVSDDFLRNLAVMVNERSSFELVVSSALRRQIGMPRTKRDDLFARFVDSKGRLHPGEGARLHQIITGRPTA